VQTTTLLTGAIDAAAGPEMATGGALPPPQPSPPASSAAGAPEASDAGATAIAAAAAVHPDDVDEPSASPELAVGPLQSVAGGSGQGTEGRLGDGTALLLATGVGSAAPSAVQASRDQQEGQGTGGASNGLTELRRTQVATYVASFAAHTACETSCWAKDSERPACSRCSVQFSLLNRRHHCRRCGEVVCGVCSANGLSLHSKDGHDMGMQRVCSDCLAVAMRADADDAKVQGQSTIQEAWGQLWQQLPAAHRPAAASPRNDQNGAGRGVAGLAGAAQPGVVGAGQTPPPEPEPEPKPEPPPLAPQIEQQQAVVSGGERGHEDGSSDDDDFHDVLHPSHFSVEHDAADHIDLAAAGQEAEAVSQTAILLISD
jgi:hypothetical protein